MTRPDTDLNLRINQLKNRQFSELLEFINPVYMVNAKNLPNWLMQDVDVRSGIPEKQ